MTGTRDKLRGLFLTALMVFSVFAGSIALAGSAAAVGNINSVSLNPGNPAPSAVEEDSDVTH
jgi:surface glycoprotein (TIGR04207 family)